MLRARSLLALVALLAATPHLAADAPPSKAPAAPAAARAPAAPAKAQDAQRLGADGKPLPRKAPADGIDPAKLPAELYAVLVTSQGKIGVRLTPVEKPASVRNFVELALGRREWTDPRSGQPTRKPLYDGTVFHRVIPGFMIQGGDPLGMGVGGPGYKLPDELDPAEHPFDAPCQLAYANSGPDTNGSQIFVTEVPTKHLNPTRCNKGGAEATCGYVRFGEGVCGCDLVGKIARLGNGKTTLDKVLIVRAKPSCQ